MAHITKPSLAKALSSNKESLDTKSMKRADKILGNPTSVNQKLEGDKHAKVTPEFVEELINPTIELMELSTFKQIYPRKVNNETAQQCVDLINASVSEMDSLAQEHYRDTLISVIDILDGSDGRYKFADYLKAVKFVTYKMMGYTDVRAYSSTFPERVNRMAKEQIPTNHLYVYANSYAKNKLVVDIHAKLIVPTHIMFQDIFHQAVEVQAKLMNDATVTPKVRSDAANSLMTHLKQPEIKKAELQINTKDTGVINELANALGALSNKTVEMMKSGNYTMKDLQEAQIIEAEVEYNE